jgi:hypothetical protein
MKTLRLLIAMGVVAAATATSAQRIQTTVDGIHVAFPDVEPMMIDGRVMVPLRGVFEHMGAYVDWDSATQTVTTRSGANQVQLRIGSFRADVNGQSVGLDSPAMLYAGRAMVPLRFISESLGATVNWLATTHTVQIITAGGLRAGPPPPPTMKWVTLNEGTVLPLKLNQTLNSRTAKVGDRFTANLVTNGGSKYADIPEGAVVEGHVSAAKPKSSSTPGVLGLAFDTIKLPSGNAYPIQGALIGLDAKSVETRDGKLVAKPGSTNDDLKYVGYGAGAGALIAIVTKGNVLTNALIGGALGFLFAEIQKDPSKSRNVLLEPGTEIGVRLTNDLLVRVPTDIR